MEASPAMKRKMLLIIALAATATVGKANGQQPVASATDTTLENKRKVIDSLDRKLFEVLGARERVVREIGVYKAQHHIAPLQAARFQKVLERGIEAGKKEGLSAEFVTEMLNAIHKESLRIEEAISDDKSLAGGTKLYLILPGN
ncbi:chorismate mutase [Chitinophaga polysaccharea]|uniref:chorismate mutase n=1 Tax=Chitinophaga polysaccharea TaxID=1293035 RepID=UPI00115706DF|nr:chorismate mutase [Chitinophaga polysaccharea]